MAETLDKPTQKRKQGEKRLNFSPCRWRSKTAGAMKTIEINGVFYNLAYLVSVQYQPSKREVMRKGEGLDKGLKFKTGEEKSTSRITVCFLGVDQPIRADFEEADALWKRLEPLVTKDPV